MTQSVMRVQHLEHSNHSNCSSGGGEKSDSLFDASDMNEKADFNEHQAIPEVEIQNIVKKYKTHKEFSKHERSNLYDNYDYCRPAMENGFEVIKLNFSNEEHKRVRLWLTSEGLSYRDLTPKHKWWDWIKGDRKIPWKEVKGFIFGAQSTTFEKHRKRVHEQLLYQKSVHESEKAMLIKQLT
jgi:hypothetical protein